MSLKFKIGLFFLSFNRKRSCYNILNYLKIMNIKVIFLDTGTVFNIMKYSIHDGPGIRTTVFLKGCPLNCWWCHNPESQAYHQEILLFQDKCIQCGKCIEACPTEALTLQNGIISVIRDQCNFCGKCTDICPTEALELVGKRMTVDEVMREVDKDQIFYDESKGGVTFSGGESLVQHKFLKQILEQCKLREIHTTLETTGYAKFEIIEAVAKDVDLFLYDLKLINDEKHKKYTGVSNQLILENLKKLSLIHHNIIIRIPLIPEINDDDENIFKTGELILSLKNIKEVHLLPYHKAGVEKYKRLGRIYKIPEIPTPDSEHMKKVAKKFEELGLKTKIGG